MTQSKGFMYNTALKRTGKKFHNSQINLKFFEPHDSFYYCYDTGIPAFSSIALPVKNFFSFSGL